MADFSRFTLLYIMHVILHRRHDNYFFQIRTLISGVKLRATQARQIFFSDALIRSDTVLAAATIYFSLAGVQLPIEGGFY